MAACVEKRLRETDTDLSSSKRVHFQTCQWQEFVDQPTFVPSVIELFHKTPDMVHETNDKNQTLMMYALEQDETHLVQFLLSNNVPCPYDAPIIAHAHKGLSLPMISILVDKAPTVNWSWFQRTLDIYQEIIRTAYGSTAYTKDRPLDILTAKLSREDSNERERLIRHFHANKILPNSTKSIVTDCLLFDIRLLPVLLELEIAAEKDVAEMVHTIEPQVFDVTKIDLYSQEVIIRECAIMSPEEYNAMIKHAREMHAPLVSTIQRFNAKLLANAIVYGSQELVEHLITTQPMDKDEFRQFLPSLPTGISYTTDIANPKQYHQRYLTALEWADA